MLDNHRRVYALAQWTVEKKTRGWYIRRTAYDDEWKGPYRSEIKRVPHDRAAAQKGTHQT